MCDAFASDLEPKKEGTTFTVEHARARHKGTNLGNTEATTTGPEGTVN